jgi:hypothetical protein
MRCGSISEPSENDLVESDCRALPNRFYSHAAFGTGGAPPAPSDLLVGPYLVCLFGNERTLQKTHILRQKEPHQFGHFRLIDKTGCKKRIKAPFGVFAGSMAPAEMNARSCSSTMDSARDSFLHARECVIQPDSWSVTGHRIPYTSSFGDAIGHPHNQSALRSLGITRLCLFLVETNLFGSFRMCS